MPKIETFLYNEQVKNNYSLYSGKDYMPLEMDIAEQYKPSSTTFFRLPYFLVPFDKDKIEYDKNEAIFFERNLFVTKGCSKYYTFFIHPTTEKIFREWIDGKYEFITAEKSFFMATPTSSYRSLLVINTQTQANFIVKLSIFGNVARGSRHIDWCSAQGQYFFSSCTQNAVHNIENFELIKDIAALGLSGEIPISFSKKYEIMFGPKKINSFGNVIRKVSDIFDEKENTFVCSVASLTSLVGENDCYFERLYRGSGKSFYDFFGDDFISKIFDKIFELFSNYGISIETHCQNTLIEISKDWKFTGKILYRDFDITSFDRARFPFLFPEMWKKYCSERLDRTSLFSNLSAREDIGKNFLVHSIDNLVKPCLLCAKKLKIITSNESSIIRDRIYSDFCKKLAKRLPLHSNLLLKTNSWAFSKDVFKDIDISEIPVTLEKIDFFEKDNYERVLVNSPELEITDYFSDRNGWILGFANNIFVEFFMPKIQRENDEL